MSSQSIRSSRQSWTVSQVQFVGVAKNLSGELTNFLKFRAQLQSANARCIVEVRVEARSFYRLLKRLETAATCTKQTQHATRPQNITKVIENLLAIDLSSDESDHWDPVRSTHWQLGESAMAGVAGGDLLVDENRTRDF